MDEQVRRQLAQARDYRQFLRLSIESSGRGQADFSRRARFSSRSFLGEVLRGKRRLSHASYGKILQALKQPADLRRLFTLLVAWEEQDVIAVGDRKNLPAKIESQRTRVLSHAAPKADLFSDEDLAVVYAALGDPIKGATANEIIRRSGLDAGRVGAILQSLDRQNAVTASKGRYFTKDPDQDLGDIGGQQGFRQTYAKSLDALRKLVLEAEPSESRLFFYSAFSISEDRLGAFKKEVQEVLLACIDRYQAEEGNRVCRLTLGFHT